MKGGSQILATPEDISSFLLVVKSLGALLVLPALIGWIPFAYCNIDMI